MIYVIPLNHAQYFWSWLTPHQPLFFFCCNQLQHLLPIIFIFGLCYPPSPKFTVSRWHSWKPWYLWRQTSHIPISSREFEECLNKTGDHTWRKRKQEENRKPVPKNGMRFLLFDKCKFTKPLKWKKCWIRQTTHCSHIRYKTNMYSLSFLLANLSS